MQRPLAALAVVLAAFASAGPAAARDLKGHLGIGGHLDSGPLGPALSVKYWVSDLGLQGLFAFDAQHSTATDSGFVEYRPGIRALYAMTRTRLTNLYVGAGLASVLRKSAKDGGNKAFAEGVIGVEHFLGDKFSVAGHLTLSVELGRTPNISLDSAAWGGSFHYYF